MYIAIDGDDSGNKITACFLNNDRDKLRSISKDLANAAAGIAKVLETRSFELIFCAADGVTALTNDTAVDWQNLFSAIQNACPNGLTFSAGVGLDLREAYIALLNSKSHGKNRLSHFSDLAS